MPLAFVALLVAGTAAYLVTAALFLVLVARLRRRMVAAEHAAVRAATQDTLTGLGNRLSLDAQYEHAAARALRDGRGMAVLFIDLDGFKAVNDRLGHETGDRVLVAVARRLRGLFRDSDLVARIGGDEFVVVATDLARGGPGALLAKADRLLEVLRAPMDVAGRTCRVGASVGIAFFPRDGATLHHLLSAADQAMYRAKRGGKDGWAVARLEGVASAALAPAPDGALGA